MKRTLRALLGAFAFSLALSAFALSTPEGFLDDYDAALSKAQVENKPIYAVFTGSDWCVYCKQLEAKLLKKSEFVEELSKGYVLLYVDLPRDRSILTEKAQEVNKPLARKYKVIGLPTILMLDKDGGTIRRLDRGKPGETPKETAKRLVDLITK